MVTLDHSIIYQEDPVVLEVNDNKKSVIEGLHHHQVGHHHQACLFQEHNHQLDLHLDSWETTTKISRCATFWVSTETFSTSYIGRENSHRTFSICGISNRKHFINLWVNMSHGFHGIMLMMGQVTLDIPVENMFLQH